MCLIARLVMVAVHYEDNERWLCGVQHHTSDRKVKTTEEYSKHLTSSMKGLDNNNALVCKQGETTQ